MTTVAHFLELAGTFFFLLLALWLVGYHASEPVNWPPPDPWTRRVSADWDRGSVQRLLNDVAEGWPPPKASVREA